MSGVAALRYLLATNVAVVALVPAERIFAGNAPKDTSAPLITLHQISGTERNTASMAEPHRLRTERVQVTVDASSYPQKKQLLELVRAACVVTNTTANGVQVLASLPEGEGPDDDDPVSRIYSQARDFMVSWRT